MRNIVYFLLVSISTHLFADDQNSETIYSSIKPLLEKFTRPFTVFDYDSENNYLSFRIAKEFPLATCVIGGRNSEVLSSMLPLCSEATELKNIILLNKSLSIADLKNLAHTEHFDMMLSFNPNPVKNLFAIAKTLSDTVITSNGQEQGIKIIQGNGTLKIKKHWFSNEKPTIPLIIDEKHQMMILSPADSKWAFNVTRAPGISLVTFLALQGSWPDLTKVENAISSISWKFHKHLDPWNIYVTGRDIEVLPFSQESNLSTSTKQYITDLLHMTPADIKKTLTINALQENTKLPE